MKGLRAATLLLCLFLLGSLALAGCGNSEGRENQSSQAGANNAKSLLVYSGAGLRKPIEEIGAAFQAETGIKVTYTFGGAAQLNNQILLTNQGDVYLPGDIAELKPVREKNLVAWEKNVVEHIPVLAVPKGNPAGIHKLADLKRPGVKVALGDPKANPIGKLADQLLQKYGLLEAGPKSQQKDDCICLGVELYSGNPPSGVDEGHRKSDKISHDKGRYYQLWWRRNKLSG